MGTALALGGFGGDLTAVGFVLGIFVPLDARVGAGKWAASTVGACDGAELLALGASVVSDGAIDGLIGVRTDACCCGALLGTGAI